MQSCNNYRGIKLISCTMTIWEIVVEARLKEEVMICEQQYGVMPKKEHYRLHVCFENADEEVQRRSERAGMCLCGRRGKNCGPVGGSPEWQGNMLDWCRI